MIYGDISIRYTLKFSNRKTLGITVTPDGNVCLTAPIGASQSKIEEIILRVTEGVPYSARNNGRYFEVVCTPKSKAAELMQAWYTERAKIKFVEIAAPVIQRFKKYGVTPSCIHIKSMTSRWGSCTPAGKIILNIELIKTPKPCIEYVITHELCHLIRRDHSKAFYELLKTEMPDWERWKKKLEMMI